MIGDIEYQLISNQNDKTFNHNKHLLCKCVCSFLCLFCFGILAILHYYNII